MNFRTLLACIVAVSCLAACEQMNRKPEETILGQGEIKVISKEQLLIQETGSVVRLELDKSSGKYLSKRYNAGQNVTLLGKRTVGKKGVSSEKITALIFEDGSRFSIHE